MHDLSLDMEWVLFEYQHHPRKQTPKYYQLHLKVIIYIHDSFATHLCVMNPRC